ncbi:MAG: hypothetical protein C4325_11350 [Blastocatellia bacterium]
MRDSSRLGRNRNGSFEAVASEDSHGIRWINPDSKIRVLPLPKTDADWAGWPERRVLGKNNSLKELYLFRVSI